jgi:hypothetical protein
MRLTWLRWLCEGLLLVLVSEGLEAVAGRLALGTEAVLGVLVANGELLRELGVGYCGSWVLLIGTRDSLEVVGGVGAWWLVVDQADWVLDQMSLAKLVVW